LAATSQNHYEVLGLWRDVNAAEIHRAYRRLALVNHPDVNPGDQAAGERFRAIREAYDVLSDPDSRERFDATLGPVTSSPRARNRPREQYDMPPEWTPPWVRDWNAEAWVKAHASPPSRTARTLWSELRRSWKKLAAMLSTLALVISLCALLDRAVPGIGTLVVAAIFMLPFFAFVISVVGWVEGAHQPPRRSRQRSE
jgi:hypothetical protein